MKKIIFFITMMACAHISMCAQNLKFGKPSKDEWNLASCSEASDAPAVVLCKNLSLTYKLAASFSAYDHGGSLDEEGASLGRNDIFTNDGTSMVYTVKMRTKILKEEGKDYANMDILYYYSNSDMNLRDEFYSFKVTLFHMVDGKVKKQNLDKTSFTDEIFNNDFRIRHMRIPEAQAGDIIEVQYELFSRRIAYIYDWQLQDEIPVRYSLCEMNIPSFLTFNVNASIRNNIKSTVDRSSIQYKKESSDLLPPKTAFSNLYRIESRDMLPWLQDPNREKKGAEIAQVKTKILNAAISGIPYPMSQPKDMKWITIAPRK